MQKSRGGKILVVDDDASSRRLLTRILSAAGYECAEATNGLEGLQRIRTDPPSILLLDFDMPELDGAQVLHRLRGDRDPAIAQIPTIMLTGHGGEESEVRGLKAGADDFVTKPINPAVLHARIETQLRLRSMRQQLQEQNGELEAWRKNLERDLGAARLTQQSLIPQKAPRLPGWQVAACYRPVIQVGGDIYGWLRMSDGRILFWIADATGHGAAAALLTTLAKLLFHHGVEHSSPVPIMQTVNADFRSIFGARSFMTAMCVALDPKTGKASVVGAGHPPLLILRRDGGRERVESCAPPLGLAERKQFVKSSVELQPGDAILLYTDGLYGGSNDDKKRLTPAALAEMLDPFAPTAESLLLHITGAIAPEGENASLADDMTAVVIRRKT